MAAPDPRDLPSLPLEAVVVDHGPRPDSPDAVVLWLHGLGADGHDFEPIVPELRLPAELSVRFIFPHAPMRPVTINNGMVMRAWYDIGWDFHRDQDIAGIRESAELVEGCLQALEGSGMPPERIVLAGFSQGGAMACHVALRHPRRLAGILVISAYLLLSELLEDEASEANRETPILQCHGSLDPVVPMVMGRRSAERLTEAGYRLTWKSYAVPHGVGPDEVVDVGAWLGEVLRDV